MYSAQTPTHYRVSLQYRRRAAKHAGFVVRALWVCLVTLAFTMLLPNHANAQTCGQDCPTPGYETTTFVGNSGPITGPDGAVWHYLSYFSAIVADANSDSFDSHLMEEFPGPAGGTSCWYSGAPYPASPVLQDPTGFGYWGIAGGDVQGQHNTYGYDYVGVSDYTLDAVDAGVGVGKVSLPCTFTIYQQMYYECSDMTIYLLYINTLATVVFPTDFIVNERSGVASTPIAFTF